MYVDDDPGGRSGGSLRGVLSAHLDRALARAAAQTHLGVFWALDESGAREAAARLDRQAASRSALTGALVAVKDIFDVVGLLTTLGVRGSDEGPARSDAEIVHLLRQAGAIPIGKASMDQLGWTTQGRAPGFPPCLNPHDPRRSPGGSSAGSAVAVASRLADIGIGTDVGGSVRIPASYCGVVGFKPAPGQLPRGGMTPVVPSFDLPGLLTRRVRDVRLVLSELVPDILFADDRPVRIGRLEDLFEATDSQVAQPCSEALELAADRWPVEATRFDWRPRGFGRLLAAELASTWGDRISGRPDAFDPSIRESVAIGREIGAADVRRIQADLSRSSRELDARLAGFDLLVCPTVPHAVPLADTSKARSVDAATRYTRPFNVLGWPAISIPCGVDDFGLPVGLQLSSRPADVGRLLGVAEALELALSRE